MRRSRFREGSGRISPSISRVFAIGSLAANQFVGFKPGLSLARGPVGDDLNAPRVPSSLLSQQVFSRGASPAGRSSVDAPDNARNGLRPEAGNGRLGSGQPIPKTHKNPIFPTWTKYLFQVVPSGLLLAGILSHIFASKQH